MQELLAELRPHLLQFAKLQLRNDSWAEDAVSETLLAAIEKPENFQGRSQLKTWLIGILKFKIIDQFRRGSREVSADAEQERAGLESIDELYDDSGHMVEPACDWGDPETALNQIQFFDVLQVCVDGLPDSQGRIFMMREWLELETDEICDQLGISSSNFHVLLHRARLRLRGCIEQNWFR